MAEGDPIRIIDDDCGSFKVWFADASKAPNAKKTKAEVAVLLAEVPAMKISETGGRRSAVSRSARMETACEGHAVDPLYPTAVYDILLRRARRCFI
jgi:hypothetical protein